MPRKQSKKNKEGENTDKQFIFAHSCQEEPWSVPIVS